MGNTELIMSRLYAVRDKTLRLSLPFVVNDGGKGYIACFTYVGDANVPTDVIDAAVGVYLVDYASLIVREFDITKQPDGLPIDISPAAPPADSDYAGYCECLDRFFAEGVMDESVYKAAFLKLCSERAIPAYEYLGAEFLS